MGFPRPVYCWVLAHIDLRSLARLGGTCSSARELLGTAGHPELTMRRRAFELDIARAREGSSLVGFAFSPPAPPSPWRGVFSPLVAWAEQRWRQPRLLTCAVVGPSAAGKSSVVFNAMRRPHHWAVPTIGGVIESVDDAASTGRRLVLHELPARLYREGLQLSGGVASFVRAVDAVVFVADARDRAGAAESRRLLREIVGGLSRTLPVLVLANKQDLDGAATPAEVLVDLEVGRGPQWSRRPWRVQGTAAPFYSDGSDRERGRGIDHPARAREGGVDAGIAWLVDEAAKRGG